VQSLLDKLGHQYGILDVRTSDPEEEQLDPWAVPSKNVKYPEITGKVPKELKIVRADLLYVATETLPPALMNQIRKLAAFQNPEFYRTQAMRLSTFGKPRVIDCSICLKNF
jgi:hypothetical protein